MGSKVHNKIIMGEHWDVENVQQFTKGELTYMLLKMEALDEDGERNNNIKTQWWIVNTKKEAPLCIGYDENNMKFVFSCVGVGVSIAVDVHAGDSKKEMFENLLRMKAKAEGIDMEKMQKAVAECKAKGMDFEQTRQYIHDHSSEFACVKDSSEIDKFTKDLDAKMEADGFDTKKMEAKMNELLNSGKSEKEIMDYMNEHMADFKKPAASGRSDW